mmetsp:Transcript_105081/g.157330  ORF Transcript_105081/g.157330 Transcript_105081/m.157330 type:complete len:415 (-) Transcript_105081:262-1506(-)
MSITDKSIKSVDVLCGRGNKINYTAGNVRFRKLVDENRYDYVTAPRHSKVEIASRVIAAVHKSGGRFLGLNPKTKKWEEVPIRRATEKACQALREDATAKIQVLKKRKRSDTTATRSSKKRTSEKKPSAAAKTTTQTKLSQSGRKTSTTKHSTKQSGKASNTSSTKESGPQAEALKKKGKKKKKKKRKESKQKRYLTEEDDAEGAALHDGVELALLSNEGEAAASYVVSPYAMEEDIFVDDPNARPFRWLDSETEAEWEILYQRLERFRKVLGHAAVPPYWAGDVALATWACRQRHLYREVVATSHRKPSDEEQMRIKRLEDLGFVWDYNKWRLQLCDNDIERSLDNSVINNGIERSLDSSVSNTKTMSTAATKAKQGMGVDEQLSNSKVQEKRGLTVNIVHPDDTDDEDFLLI